MRRLAVLAVVGLVLLAGCNGLIGGPADGPDGADGADTTDGGATTDAGDGSDGSASEYPPGYTKDGPESLSLALQHHYSAIRPHPYTSEFVSNRGTEFRGSVRAAGGESGTAHATFVEEGAPTRDLYLEDGTTYRRVNRPGNVTYGAVNSTYDNFRFQLTGPTLQWLMHVRWNHVGTSEEADRTLHRYKTTGINDSNEAAPDPARVSNLDGTLVVDEQGVIHEFSLTANVGEGSIQYRYAVSDIDDTEVSPPDWLSTAKEQANNASDSG